MPAIDSVMKKLGFVKIAKFGLVLTPEGRLMSMRPVVLDDGFGGKIVGWQDGDLAAAELEQWQPRGAVRPASPAAVASRVAAPRPPVPTQPLPVVRAPAPAIPTRAAPVAAAPVAIVREHVMPIAAIQPPAPALIVAPPPVVEEDDWEWTIAIARARAAAEDVEVAVVAAQAPQRRKRADTLPPPMIAKAPAPITPVTSVTENAGSVRVAPPTPSTVIPIPRMPSASPRSSSIAPVVRQTLPTPILPTPPRRFAKGTSPVLPQSAAALEPPVKPPVPAMSDDTIPNISLPPAAAAVALPSIKRLSRG
jgi:hypothetical protein